MRWYWGRQPRARRSASSPGSSASPSALGTKGYVRRQPCRALWGRGHAVGCGRRTWHERQGAQHSRDVSQVPWGLVGQGRAARVPWGSAPPPASSSLLAHATAVAGGSGLALGPSHLSVAPGRRQPRTCSRVVSPSWMRSGSSGAQTVKSREACRRRDQKSTRAPRAPRLSLPPTNTASQLSATWGGETQRGRGLAAPREGVPGGPGPHSPAAPACQPTRSPAAR